jgi:hypothetical protein
LLVKPKARRTSAQVTEAAKRKVSLQHQADELAQQHIATLAAMEMEEEEAAMAEQRAVVKTLATSNGLDDVGDVEIQSNQEGDHDEPMAVDAHGDSGSEVDKAKSAPSKVCLDSWMLVHLQRLRKHIEAKKTRKGGFTGSY